MDVTLPLRVRLLNWPSDGGHGGQIAPADEPIEYWTVDAVHARYVAPHGPGRFRLKAVLVDVRGRTGTARSALPDLERVLVHQVPRVGWWMLKRPSGHDLRRIERYRDR
ncbi:hypothetical protein [Spongiactinospora sp. TRM90649]|uniref:hypothetical protein n=1 Tax=Spongiactinospora sp. TRM90649 TaxID=3031114 RepID=UPI0023F86089|nr:hypothetical protein [Spongiactinospora sp. TRM90649]MDF5755749.1 hypothetical protein [Spongiactinospora sp. TRM90649]